MPKPRLACPHCGEIDWSRAPGLRAALRFIRARGDVTSRDIAEAFGLSIANANNRLRALQDLGEIRQAETRTVPGGGVEGVYAAVPFASPAARSSTPEGR